MMKLFKILFINTMIIGTLISISSYSWLSTWIGLEINLLSFIPLFKNNKNKFSTEAAIKYFIAQTMGSSMLLFSISNMLLMKNITTYEYSLFNLMISSTLLLKTGAAPFHFWFPEVSSGLNWNNFFMLLTWQKIGPMILLMYQIKTIELFFTMIIILSSMISGLQGLNQTCMRKILTYSSINHISWMISSMLMSLNIFYYYFLMYTLINMSIIMILKKFNILFLNQLNQIFSYNKKIKFLFMMNFLSLGGLPPFLGFLPKWLTINCMIENYQFTVATIMIIFSLITLYFYLRITFSSFSIFSKETLILSFKNISFYHMLFSMISITGLIFCSMVKSIM
uniref:NADH-ubiquinone oxidoreductase chain 2 n=1 Tax=Curculionidae sp. BMNH 1042554 TaxID=2834647 RepID=A0A8F5A1G3_9CUCU|nr:NADH dehydrogenase subunit 2 [Curculionidae sp. BMNH 1042554]